MAQTKRGFITLTDINDGTKGIDGADGTNGFAVAQLSVYIRASSAPSTPTGGSYNFVSNALTAPSGWSNVAPSGSDPVYQTVSNVQSDAGGTGTKTPTWGSPAKLVEDGTDGAAGGDGTSGTSVYTANVFRRESSAPSTPTVDDGSFNFTSNTLTAPSGWSGTVPAGSDPLYVSTGSFSIAGDTGTDNTVTWTSPVIQSQDGTDGSAGGDGLSTYLFSVFRRESSAPSTPTGGSYNFGNNTPTAPSGWETSVPAGANPLYTTSALASVTGSTATDSSLTWVTPVIQAENGADGAAGAPGSFERTVYRNVAETDPATTPTTPVGGDEDTSPTDWSFIPADSENQRWKSYARFGDGREVDAKEVSEITFGGETGGASGSLAVAEITTIGITGAKSAPAPAAATVEKTSITFAGTSADSALGEGFSIENVSGGPNMRDADFGNNLYVAVGGSGAAVTTTNPASGWSVNSSAGTSGNIRGVAYGNGLWVACGTGGNKIYSTTDPTTGAWTSQSGPTETPTKGGNATDNPWLDIAYGNGTFIIVGSNGLIISSSDGETWKNENSYTATPTLLGIEFKNNLFVVVGGDGGTSNITTSPGGTSGSMTWSNNITAQAGNQLLGVTFGDGLWVAVGGSGSVPNIITATDPTLNGGTTGWTSRSSSGTGVGNLLSDIAYLGGTWLASSRQNHYITSTDGITWDTAASGWGLSSFTGTSANTESGQFINNTYIATGEGGAIITAAAGDASIFTIDGDNRHFPSGPVPVVLGSSSGGDSMAAKVRTEINTAKAAGTITDLTVLPVETGTEDVVKLDSANGGAFVTIFVDIAGGAANTATATALTTTEGAGTGGSQNEQTQLTFSNVTDSILTSFSTVGPTVQASQPDFWAVEYGNGVYVAVGDSKSSPNRANIYISTNGGSSWLDRASANTNGFNSLVDVAYGVNSTVPNGIWVAVGDNGIIMTSIDDGETWQLQTATVTDKGMFGVSFGNGIFVMAGYKGNVESSVDGINWVVEDSKESSQYLLGLTFGDGRFVAVGGGGVITTSTDGDNVTRGSMDWNKVSESGISTSLRQVFHGNGLFVATGNSGSMTISSNGTSWGSQTSGAPSILWGGAYASGLYTVQGSSGFFAYSINGTSWTPVPAATLGIATSLRLRKSIFANDKLFIVGDDGTILTATGTPSTLTINGDSSELAGGSLSLPLFSLADGDLIASQVAAFLNDNTTGLSNSAAGSVVQVDSTTVGTRTAISSSISGSGDVAVTRQQQGLNASSASSSTFTITAASATHSPSTFTGTFGSEVLPAVALATVKTAFTDGSIGGYTVGTTANGSFSITSTTAGDEADLTFVITSGTGGGLLTPSPTPVTTLGADAINAVLDTWEVVINGVSYTDTFAASSPATTTNSVVGQAEQAMLFLNAQT